MPKLGILTLLVLRVLYVVFNMPVEKKQKDDDDGDNDGHCLEPEEPTDPEAGLTFDSKPEHESERWSEPTTVSP